MGAVFDVVLPVFGIMLAGFLAGQFRLLGQGSSQALNGYVYYVALPALFFLSMARVPVAEALNLPFLAAFGGGLLAVFLASAAVAAVFFPNRNETRRFGAIGLHAMSAIFANTGYMGIPLLAIAYQDAARLPAIISSILNGVLVMALVTVVIEIDLHRGSDRLTILRRVATGVARSPLVISAVLGLGVSAAGLSLPAPFVTFCDLLGVTAGPCALFAIGLFMVGKSIRAGLGEVLWVSLLKLVAQPLLTWWLAFEVLHLEPIWAASAVILAALPTGALTFVLAQRYGVYVERATSVILVSTLLSIGTLTLVFVLLSGQPGLGLASP